MHFEHAAPAFRTPMDGPLPALLKQAVKFSFERDAVFVRDGGTIGAMTSIEKVLEVSGAVSWSVASGARLPRAE